MQLVVRCWKSFFTVGIWVSKVYEVSIVVYCLLTYRMDFGHSLHKIRDRNWLGQAWWCLSGRVASWVVGELGLSSCQNDWRKGVGWMFLPCPKSRRSSFWMVAIPMGTKSLRTMTEATALEHATCAFGSWTCCWWHHAGLGHQCLSRKSDIKMMLAVRKVYPDYSWDMA